MTIAERIKSLRKQAGLSQEQLAETLNVSRQAITKWETGAGLPDVGNAMELCERFGISLDELFREGDHPVRFPYESVTEYDVDCVKRFDVRAGGAACITLSGYEGEKIRVRLASETIPTLQQDFKVKIEDVRDHVDVAVRRSPETSESTAKQGLDVAIEFPQKYLSRIELSAHAQKICLRDLTCETAELNVKTPDLLLNGFNGTVEIDCNLDMNVDCVTLNGAVEFNQISASSQITLPADVGFRVLKRGIGNRIYFEERGVRTESFADETAKNVVELNGMKSELIIRR